MIHVAALKTETGTYTGNPFVFRCFCHYHIIHIVCLSKNVRLYLIRVVHGLWIIKIYASLLKKRCIKQNKYSIHVFGSKNQLKMKLF